MAYASQMPLPFPALEVPIALAPMAGSAGPRLVAAVCNAGGFGILPLAYATPERMRADVAELRSLTSRPFGINLFVERPLEDPGPALARAHERLRPFREALGIPHPGVPPHPPDHYAAQIDAAIALAPSVLSFTFGVPDDDVVRRTRAAGIVTLGTATTVAEAIANERAGMDAVTAQGSEAGAHRGTFLLPVEDSLVGTLALVPQVVDAVRIPVLAAGGIGDGRGVAAALALGAIAAQVGTSFLLADEALTPLPHRRAIGSEAAAHTVLTTAFSGRAARGIANRVIREITAGDIAPYPFQNALTRDIRTAAAAAHDGEYLSLWSGQAASLARSEPAAAIVERLMAETHAALHTAERRL